MYSANWPRHFARAVPVASATLVAAWSAVVLLGWIIHNPWLVQVRPNLVPTQFNTALGLLGGGGALLLHRFGRPRLALLATGLTLALGLTALLETYGRIDLGIDTLFVKPFTLVHTESPGRMSVNSATTFCLAGTMLLALAGGREREGARLLAALLAAVVLAVGLDALFGYAARVQMAYGWTIHSEMGINTASALVLLGAGTWVQAWNESAIYHGASPGWIAIPVLLASLLATVGLWQLLAKNDARQVEQRVQAKAFELANRLSSDIRSRERDLNRMADRLSRTPDMSEAQWEADVINLSGDEPGTQVIEVLDASGHARWEAPRLGIDAERHLPASSNLLRLATRLRAREEGRPVISPSFTLPQGGSGFAIDVPIARENGPDELLSELVRTTDLVQPLVDTARSEGFELTLLAGSKELVRSADHSPTEERWMHAAHVEVPGLDWDLRVWPTRWHLRELHSAVPMLGGLLGLLFSLMLTAAVQYGRNARQRSRALSQANARLALQIEERQEAEERFRSALEAVPNAIVMVSEGGRITLVNSQTLQWFGYLREELIGQPIEILVPERCRAQHRSERAAYMGQPVARPVGLQLPLVARRKDGSEFPADIALGPLHTRDGLQIIAAINDITQHEQAETELKQANNALNAVNQELESFAYAVSHDLRQPLRSMTGFSEIVQSDYRDKLDDQGRDYLQRIHAAAKRMGELIDALLRLSRITRTPLTPSPVDLTALAWEIAQQIQQLDGSRRVDWQIADGLVSHGDAPLLRALLENLLGNAWKFTTRRENARIEVGQSGENGTTTFYVRDNGAGFDMTYADKLFGAFQRLHGVNEYPGSGIGLATAQRIVHRHGGRIWAESQIDAGATFHFTLRGRPT